MLQSLSGLSRSVNSVYNKYSVNTRFGYNNKPVPTKPSPPKGRLMTECSTEPLLELKALKLSNYYRPEVDFRYYYLKVVLFANDIRKYNFKPGKTYYLKVNKETFDKAAELKEIPLLAKKRNAFTRLFLEPYKLRVDEFAIARQVIKTGCQA